MKAIVDPKLCIGCGLCVELAPEIFEMKEGKTGMVSIVRKMVDGGEKTTHKMAKNAALACPSEAIKLINS